MVLPAPFGPISAWRAPFSIASETSCVGGDAAEALFEPDGFEDRHDLNVRPGAAPPTAAGRAIEPRAEPDDRFARTAAVHPSTRSRPTSTITTSTKPIQNCQYCGVSVAIQSCRNL